MLIEFASLLIWTKPFIFFREKFLLCSSLLNIDGTDDQSADRVHICFTCFKKFQHLLSLLCHKLAETWKQNY
jgi:hypothetical protein